MLREAAKASGGCLFGDVSRAAAGQIISIWSFFLQSGSAAISDDSKVVRAAIFQLRQDLAVDLMQMVRSAEHNSPRVKAVVGAFLRAHGLRRCSRLLSQCAQDLRRSPSRRHKEAAIARLTEVASSLGPLALSLLEPVAYATPGELCASRQAHVDLIAAELRHSGVLESWACCFLQLLLSEREGDATEGLAAERLLTLFAYVAARFSDGGASIDSDTAASGPALRLLWSAVLTQLAAALDGGPLYGMPEEVVRALALVEQERSGARDDSPSAACEALKIWTNMLVRRATAAARAGSDCRRDTLQQKEAAADARAGSGGQLGTSGAEADTAPTPLRGAHGEPLSPLLPYNTRALHGLCMRLARSGIAAWGGRQQGAAAGGSGASPAAAAACGSGAADAAAAASQPPSRTQPLARLSRQDGMQLAVAALKCAMSGLRVRSAEAQAANRAAAGCRSEVGQAARGSHAVAGPSGSGAAGAGSGAGGAEGGAEGGAAGGGAGAGAGLCRPRVRLAALEGWVDVLSDACVLAVGERGAGDPSPEEIAEWLLDAHTRALQGLLGELMWAVAEAEPAVASAAVGRLRRVVGAARATHARIWHLLVARGREAAPPADMEAEAAAAGMFTAARRSFRSKELKAAGEVLSRMERQAAGGQAALADVPARAASGAPQVPGGAAGGTPGEGAGGEAGSGEGGSSEGRNGGDSGRP